MNHPQPQPTVHQPGGKLRLRALGLLTLLFLAGWGWAAWWIWHVYMPHLELSALFSFFMAAGMGGGRSGANNFTAQPIDAVVAVAVRHIWFALMCMIGLVMAVAALAGLAGARWSRRLFLAAGLAVLAGTAATMTGIAVLIYKAHFPATITPLGYVLLGLVQSSAGWVLILGSVGGWAGPSRRRSAAGPTVPAPSPDPLVSRARE